MRSATATLVSLLAGCTETGVHADVAYDDRYGDATTMDIHVPAGAVTTARPTVMLIHGGAWRAGDKEAYTEAAERYAAAGYVAATINYRLYPAATYPASVHDCVCALSFLRANAAQYGIDPARIAVGGYSAGGHLSALVGTAIDLHQGDCAWGPTAAPAAVIPGDATYDWTQGDINFVVSDWMGGSRDALPEAYATASPAVMARPDAPPFLVVHGIADPVPVESARELVEALRAQGNSARLLELGGAGHLTSAVTATEGVYLQAATDTPEAWAVTFDFLASTVGEP